MYYWTLTWPFSLFTQVIGLWLPSYYPSPWGIIAPYYDVCGPLAGGFHQGCGWSLVLRDLWGGLASLLGVGSISPPGGEVFAGCLGVLGPVGPLRGLASPGWVVLDSWPMYGVQREWVSLLDVGWSWVLVGPLEGVGPSRVGW